jgi:hypothetical protein
LDHRGRVAERESRAPPTFLVIPVGGAEHFNLVPKRELGNAPLLVNLQLGPLVALNPQHLYYPLGQIFQVGLVRPTRDIPETAQAGEIFHPPEPLSKLIEISCQY